MCSVESDWFVWMKVMNMFSLIWLVCVNEGNVFSLIWLVRVNEGNIVQFKIDIGNECQWCILILIWDMVHEDMKVMCSV